MLSLVFASLTLSLNVLQSTPASTPDFSGSWTMERSRSQSTESATIEIKQSATAIIIVTHSAGETSTRTYPVESSAHSTHEPADVHMTDALEAQGRQRPLDGLALRVEDPRLRPDQDPRPHSPAPVRSSQAENGSPANRS